MRSKYPPLIAFCILAYSVWNSWSLTTAWQTAPFEYYSWIPFLVWIFPVLAFYFGPSCRNLEFSTANSMLLVLSLTTGLLGNIGSINAFCYVGLALCLAGLAPWSYGQIPWLLSSVSWMPALGWLLSHTDGSFPLLLQNFSRILLALIGSLWMIMVKRSNSRESL